MSPPSEPSLNKGDLVQSLARGLAVIRAFNEAESDLTVTDVARLAGVTRAAARRFLLTLTELGYVAPTAGPSRCGRQSSSSVTPT